MVVWVVEHREMAGCDIQGETSEQIRLEDVESKLDKEEV
jgi:hypothetical protein